MHAVRFERTARIKAKQTLVGKHAIPLTLPAPA
jgi:hypothetical protein